MNTSAWTGTIADIERRVLWANASEQIAPLRAVHRRFLELQDLLHAAERHGDPPAKRGVLLGQALALKLSPPESGGGIYSADVDQISASHRSSIGDIGAVCTHLEQKSDSVLGIPSLSLLPTYPSEYDIEAEQCLLLRAHSQLVAELVSEAELLSALCQHNKSHPIYDVACGLESYFGGLIDSLTLKLKLVSAEMYQALYTPAVVQATARLRAILDAKQASLAKEHAKLNERLAIYRDAGSEFQEIASAYARVLKETDHIRQDIARVSQL
ncbi:hypothetical protein GGH94_000344 [Coemansia aciculifera]|uniref:HAUS augmin-like complex subunit 4 n=1 Tax=Coemansia aciculifera TaxID=417176 RepID=A0A9W8IST1_9FUNG|nr:hypothetical protein GGH94_000344 [Coemansia aciculifera]KAJ2874900.1 hypothetical protein GGH93_002028 [Coemansia aciculifera]